jgi:hypothetical protein
MSPALPVCSVCSKRDAPNYFRVQRVSPGGVESPLTTTCSARCLLQWTYSVASLQGMRLAFTAREAIKQLFGALRS